MNSGKSNHHLRSFENPKANIFMESPGTKGTIRVVRSCFKNFWHGVDLDNKKGDRLVVGHYQNGDLHFNFMERFSRGVSTILEFKITDNSASIFGGQFCISDMADDLVEEHLKQRLAVMQEKKERQ